MNVQGAALTKLKQYQEAELLLLASRDALKQSPVPNLEAKGRARLADLYAAWGRPADAEKYRLAN